MVTDYGKQEGMLKLTTISKYAIVTSGNLTIPFPAAEPGSDIMRREEEGMVLTARFMKNRR